MLAGLQHTSSVLKSLILAAFVSFEICNVSFPYLFHFNSRISSNHFSFYLYSNILVSSTFVHKFSNTFLLSGYLKSYFTSKVLNWIYSFKAMSSLFIDFLIKSNYSVHVSSFQVFPQVFPSCLLSSWYTRTPPLFHYKGSWFCVIFVFLLVVFQVFVLDLSPVSLSY